MNNTRTLLAAPTDDLKVVMERAKGLFGSFTPADGVRHAAAGIGV